MVGFTAHVGGIVSALMLGARLVAGYMNETLGLFDWLMAAPILVTVATVYFLFVGHSRIVGAVSISSPTW